MYAGRIRRSLSGADHGEGPGVIGEQCVGVWTAVVEILIVNCGLCDRDGALLIKLEIRVRSNGIGLEVIRVRYRCVVVQASAGAGDVVPPGIDVDRFTKADRHGSVVRNDGTVS